MTDFKMKVAQRPGVSFASYRDPQFLNDMLIHVQKYHPDVRKRDFEYWVRVHGWITDDWVCCWVKNQAISCKIKVIFYTQILRFRSLQAMEPKWLETERK